MLFGQVERELLWENTYLNWHNKKLPNNYLHLPIDQEQGKQDIWECQCEEIQAAVSKDNLKKVSK